MEINYNDIKVIKRGQSGFVSIYVLIDPTNHEIRYVGKANDINVRFKEHIRKCKLSNTHKNNWIQSLLQKNQLPILEVIDVVPEENWGVCEQRWIAKFRNDGVRLTNLANGGEGGNLGAIVNKKISEALKGRVVSDETKLKISKSRIGTKHSMATRLKFSNQRVGDKNSMYGKKHSEETKEKIGAKSKINSNGNKNGMFGKKHSNETKEKISNTLSSINSGENNPFYGKKHTIETKEKMFKKVKQIDTSGKIIKIWNSFKEAADTLNINSSGISGACNKKNKSYKNYKWEK